MKKGLSRFIFYTEQIKVLIKRSGEQKDPAMWLFRNNARTPFFMLEGLAKLYSGLHNEKKFKKLKEHFKLVEDGIGQIDYYDSLYHSFKSEKKIPVVCRQYINEQINRSSKHLNEVLTVEDWLSGDNRRIVKITKKLNEADWMKPSEEVEAISEFYKDSFSSINDFIEDTRYHFDNVEEDVHELRRKLRWLSIYPQALQGAVQYSADEKPAAGIKKYLTNEIVNSPFNKFSEPGDNTAFLLFRKNHFLALSWVIAELGKLKDEGLLLHGLCEALIKSASCSEDEALERAYLILGSSQRKMEKILDDAEVIAKQFFAKNILQNLIAGTKT